MLTNNIDVPVLLVNKTPDRFSLPEDAVADLFDFAFDDEPVTLKMSMLNQVEKSYDVTLKTENGTIFNFDVTATGMVDARRQIKSFFKGREFTILNIDVCVF